MGFYIAVLAATAASAANMNPELSLHHIANTLNGKSRAVYASSDGLSTTTCSHTRCVMAAYTPGEVVGGPEYSNGHHFVQVMHHNEESYGNKHVCRRDMHEVGKCGCECFDEAYGLFPLTNALADFTAKSAL